MFGRVQPMPWARKAPMGQDLGGKFARGMARRIHGDKRPRCGAKITDAMDAQRKARM